MERAHKKYDRTSGWQNFTADDDPRLIAAAADRQVDGWMVVCGDNEWVRNLLSTLGVRVFAEVESPSGSRHPHIAVLRHSHGVAQDGSRVPNLQRELYARMPPHYIVT